MNGNTKVVVKGNRGGAQRTEAGVVMPDKDAPGRFEENTIGKA